MSRTIRILVDGTVEVREEGEVKMMEDLSYQAGRESAAAIRFGRLPNEDAQWLLKQVDAAVQKERERCYAWTQQIEPFNTISDAIRDGREVPK